MNVLIVEPDDDLCAMLAFLVRHAGHGVATARNAADALSLLLVTCPDLLLTESVLPDGSGLALCQSVRRIGDAGVIMLGESSDAAAAAQALAFGALAYLSKPFSVSLLRAHLVVCQPKHEVAVAQPAIARARGAVARRRRQAVPA